MKYYDAITMDLASVLGDFYGPKNKHPRFLGKVLESLSRKVWSEQRIAYIDFGKYAPRRFDPDAPLGVTPEQECYELLRTFGWTTIYSPTVPTADQCIRYACGNTDFNVLVASADPEIQRGLPLEASLVWVFDRKGEVVTRFF